MTRLEQAAIEQADPTSVALSWRSDPDPRFVRLQAAPCPFLQADKSCGVYDVRPLICRTFMCGRVDVAAEPYETDRITGCGNLTDRLRESHRFREHYATNGRKTMQRWGKEHGWATSASS